MGLNGLVHLGVMAVLIVVVVFVAVANVPARELSDDTAHGRRRAALARAPARALVGLARAAHLRLSASIMLGMAFAEGGANDWLALGVVEGHGSDEARRRARARASSRSA